MDVKGQILVFCLCIGVGFLGGIIYEILSFFTKTLSVLIKKRKILYFLSDILFFILFAVLCVISGVVFRFPDFRGYMLLGYAVGGIIYLKTLHRMVAFCEKVCYNKLTERIKRTKKKEKTLKKEVN